MALKGKPSPLRGIPSGKKGTPSPFKGTKRPNLSAVKQANPQIAWNKGKTGVYSEEQLISMSEAAKAKPKKECPHCGKILDPANFGKYHGDKCKNKK